MGTSPKNPKNLVRFTSMVLNIIFLVKFAAIWARELEIAFFSLSHQLFTQKKEKSIESLRYHHDRYWRKHSNHRIFWWIIRNYRSPNFVHKCKQIDFLSSNTNETISAASLPKIVSETSNNRYVSAPGKHLIMNHFPLKTIN